MGNKKKTISYKQNKVLDIWIVSIFSAYFASLSHKLFFLFALVPVKTQLWNSGWILHVYKPAWYQSWKRTACVCFILHSGRKKKRSGSDKNCASQRILDGNSLLRRRKKKTLWKEAGRQTENVWFANNCTRRLLPFL